MKENLVMNKKNNSSKDFDSERLNVNQHKKNSDLIKPIKEKIILKAFVESIEITQDLLKEITDYSVECIPNEAIGLLGGEEIRPNELLISKAIFVTKGNEYSVAFTEHDFQRFEEIMSPIFCVGWWHSHPGYGLFLSQTDIYTQIYSFQVAHNLSVALVVDPKDLSSNGLASFQFFQVEGDSLSEQYQYKEIASYLSNRKLD
jgi:proteasome lid subunit RPN8/RPN11